MNICEFIYSITSSLNEFINFSENTRNSVIYEIIINYFYFSLIFTLRCPSESFRNNLVGFKRFLIVLKINDFVEIHLFKPFSSLNFYSYPISISPIKRNPCKSLLKNISSHRNSLHIYNSISQNHYIKIIFKSKHQESSYICSFHHP